MRLADCPSRRYEQRYRDGVQAAAAQAPSGTRPAQVLAAIGREVVSIAEIARKVGISRDQVKNILGRLRNEGAVVKAGSIPSRRGPPTALYRLA